MFRYFLIVCSLTFFGSVGAKQFQWPKQYKAAISLGYDDALLSQINNAIPKLNHFGFKGSFYLSLNSNTLKTHLSDWQTAAKNGHELANHSIFHQCSASKPERDWVAADYDLDNLSATFYAQQIAVANNYLYALDGGTHRTFTAPCADVMAAGEFYLDKIKTLFKGIKARVVEQPIDNVLKENPYAVSFIAPYDVSAHDELLEYLFKHKNTYWTT